MGFCPNRSTTDNIFIITVMFEKCCEHNIDLHITPVNYTQAFGSVYRNNV